MPPAGSVALRRIGNYLGPGGGGPAVAVPSRIFVGITIFGLLSAFVVVPFTVLVVTCDPDSQEPLFTQFGGTACATFGAGQKIFLALASILTVAFTVLAWKALLAGARRDAMRRRRQREEGRTEPMTAQAQGPEAEGPPGLRPR